MGEYDYLRDSLRDSGLSDDEIEKVIENEKRMRSMFNHAIERNQASKQSVRGQNKKGHEGPLKQYIRDVINDGACDFDAVLAALEEHVMIGEITDETLTYFVLPSYKETEEEEKKKMKPVQLQTVKKAYREITEQK